MAETEAVYFNPWDAEFRANPYPHYKPLMTRPPHNLDLFMPMTLVARYQDVVQVLHDHEHFSSVMPKLPIFEEQRQLFGEAATVLFSDPPVHTRLRRLVTRAFTPRRIANLEGHIRSVTNQLLDKVVSSGRFELMNDVAAPLPVMVIAGMLDVPSTDYARFKYWSDKIVESDNTLPGTPQPPEIVSAFHDLRGYFAGEIERRRDHPGDDLVSLLIDAHETDEALSADELLSFVVLLLIAGNETTTNLLGNGMLTLGRNPDQFARLRANSASLPGAIEEMLRFDGPVQATTRFTSEAVNLNGTEIPAGGFVFVILAAANRDPAQFIDPEHFEIARDPNRHVAFGEGIHFCLGAALARLEARVAFEAMLARFPRLTLATPEKAPAYKGSYFLRGPAALELALE
ncbi:MAG: cytochrome P450 [Candidatus Binataceae bacterium]